MSETNKDFEEFLLEQMDDETSRRERVADEFVGNFVEEYSHKNINGYLTHYKHENDAEAFRAGRIGNFWVTFSIPKNKDAVVCSFWGMEVNEYGGSVKRKVQIDLFETMKHIIELHYNRTHLPMPKYEGEETDLY